MDLPWLELAGHAGVLVALCWLWDSVRQPVERLSIPASQLLLGALLSAGYFVSTMAPVQLQGVAFDPRYAYVAIACLFGGPWGASLGVIPMLVFIGSPGTVGALPAIVGTGIVAIIGLMGHFFAIGRLLSAAVAVLAVTATLASLVFSPGETGFAFEFKPDQQMAAALTGLITLAVGLALCASRERTGRLALYEAAIRQVPAHFYIKDAYSKFVAVSDTVARHHGYDDPRQLVGKSDRDLAPPDRAKSLQDDEDHILSGADLGERIETINEADGPHTYRTIKVPVPGPGGFPLGLVGLTQEITAHVHDKQELQGAHDLLAFLMDDIPQGVALFDSAGVLVYRNEKYVSHFPRTAHARAVGTPLRQILERVITTGEQLNLPRDTGEWIDAVIAALGSSRDELVELYNGHWIEVHTRPSVAGSTLVVVTDVTAHHVQPARATA